MFYGSLMVGFLGMGMGMGVRYKYLSFGGVLEGFRGESQTEMTWRESDDLCEIFNG